MTALSGRTYWIVGASEGLGRALALALSREGARLVLSARSAGRLSRLAAEAKALEVQIAEAEARRPAFAGKIASAEATVRDAEIELAQALAAQGAELAFSYQGEALKKRVEPLAASIGMGEFIECDVADEASIDALFARLKALWGRIDFVVHAIGFSDKNELRGRYVDTGIDNFRMTMDISVYSFTAVCRRAAAMMPDGGSLLTLTYYGAEKVMPNYNVMGVAKAGL